MQEVLSVHLPAKKPKMITIEPGSITFTKTDLGKVQHPHSDPLVIQLRMNNYDVKRILMDIGSSIKIRASSQELMIEFVVVNILSPYNTIIGRDWLHKIKGVASTLHEAIKFATPQGKETLYGDQATIKEVQLIEQEQEVLEDDKRDPEAKVIEDLIHYELNLRWPDMKCNGYYGCDLNFFVTNGV
ncbi:uncharacterized protein LOC130757378 [Actinidia eriantha]|uniref:uncharacterized protein LOC130757378 n=1 Tax=Actinidia eriantha TaxID=165200 RepID=UPI00258D2686|nr:uncharacterized protein LOC130757378 [Actinidia eriantha]